MPTNTDQTSLNRYRLPIDKIERGMFVVEVDRPWLDTPFLLEGLMVEDEAEIATLRQHCRYAYVDLSLSRQEVADAIRRALPDEPGSERSGGPLRREPPAVPAAAPGAAAAARFTAPPPTAVRAAADSRERRRRPAAARLDETPLARKRGSMFRRGLRWLRELVGPAGESAPGPADAADAAPNAPANARPASAPAPARRSRSAGTARRSTATEAQARRSLAATAARLELPAEIELQRYPPPHPIETELPRAQAAWSKCADLLVTLTRDLATNTVPDIRNIGEVADGLVESMIGNPDAMMWVARLHAERQKIFQHSLKVALYLIALGRHVGFPREDLVHLGTIGMLADVGMIRIPRELLDKPGMLTPAEHDVVKQHVQLGIEALRRSTVLDEKVEQGILQHHERLDGSGYPLGLTGRDIGIFGRMAAIADCFVALVSDRAHAKAQSPQQALMNLYRWTGTGFHEPMVEQFVQAIGVFPVGSLVELSNGEAALVLAHNLVRRLEPRVLVLAAPDKTPVDKPFERDLLNGPTDCTGQAIRIARGLPAGAYGLNPGDYYADQSAAGDGLAPLAAA